MGIISIIAMFMGFALAIPLALDETPFFSIKLSLWLKIILMLLLFACILFAASGV